MIGELDGPPRRGLAAHPRAGPSATRAARTPTSPAATTPSTATRSIDMAMYAIELAGAPPGRAAARRPHVADPRRPTSAASPMTDIDFGSFFVQLVTAGNDTTKTMLSSGLLALLQHPDQLAELRADPSLIPGAVEEILRWANPLHYFRRTATADTVLHGVDDRRRRQGGDVLHVGQPRRGRVRRPARVRHPPRTRTRTCRSASPSTSASACTSPGSRAGCSSRSCSRRSRRIELTGEPRPRPLEPQQRPERRSRSASPDPTTNLRQSTSYSDGLLTQVGGAGQPVK